MKRCPECGYRVKAEDLRICPLCGVRMHHDPHGSTVKLRTHVHENEKCLLPNPTEEAAKARRKKAGEQLYKPVVKREQMKLPKQAQQLLAGLVIVILYALLASCTA